MTTPDELERAVERLNRAVARLTEDAKRLGSNSASSVVSKADLRLLLSERAELLATVACGGTGRTRPLKVGQ